MSLDESNAMKRLLRKLGIRTGMKLMYYNQPDYYYAMISPLPDNCEVIEPSSGISADVIHLFFESIEEMENITSDYIELLSKKGRLWISWPETEEEGAGQLNKTVVSEFALKLNLTPLKVSRIDETWLGVACEHGGK
jgi:tetrahydromethanopterin S-methyltransferase subunit B